MTAPVLVLDLDGTLVDTLDDLVATLNVILAREGMAPVDRSDARPYVGHGSRAMLQAAFDAQGRPLPAETLDRLWRAFLDHYAAHIADHSRPFPGAEAMLDRFAAGGWRLAVCTNKLEGLARQVLDALDLTRRFAVVSGPDTFGVKKPDPRHITETVRAAGGTPQRAVMVGDSIIDVEAARATRVPVVGVAFGYSAVPMAELEPDRVIGHFDELWDAVAGLEATVRAAGVEPVTPPV
jgi:phosphoglycolate phosphatase